MFVLGLDIIEQGPATAGECIFRRLCRARRAREKAMEGEFELSNGYLEWLNYIWAAENTGLERPWALPEHEAADYLRWLIAAEDPPGTPGRAERRWGVHPDSQKRSV